MTNEKVKDQEVKEEKTFNDADGNPSCEGSSCANVADEEHTSADNVAEGETEESAAEAEPSQEEIIAVWRDKYMRLQAEFDNYRKRTLREKMELIENGGRDVLKAILPILDDMQRATAASEKSDDINALREGEKLVVQKFIDTLRQNKVVEIEALDAQFDENLHEAVARFAAGEDKSGKVIDVVERGYMLGDKVLRYAKVVVGE